MKNKIEKILKILVILFVIFTIYKEIKVPFFIGGSYIVNFDDKEKVLEQADKELIRDIIFPTQDINSIQIKKLVYTDSFRHEGTLYIFEGGRIYRHICLGTGICKEFKAIKQVVDKYYKWWENNEKDLNIDEIQKKYIIEI